MRFFKSRLSEAKGTLCSKWCDLTSRGTIAGIAFWWLLMAWRDALWKVTIVWEKLELKHFSLSLLPLRGRGEGETFVISFLQGLCICVNGLSVQDEQQEKPKSTMSAELHLQLSSLGHARMLQKHPHDVDRWGLTRSPTGSTTTHTWIFTSTVLSKNAFC